MRQSVFQCWDGNRDEGDAIEIVAYTPEGAAAEFAEQVNDNNAPGDHMEFQTVFLRGDYEADWPQQFSVRATPAGYQYTARKT